MKKILLILLAVLLLAGCTQEQIPQTAPAEGTFTLSFITVGKGDAFLLETPRGQFYLVDTGKAQDYQQIVRVLRTKNVSVLSGIFLTHGHKDHAGCLEPLLNAFPVEKVYISKVDTVSYREIDPRKIVPKYAQTSLEELSGGEVLDLGGVKAQVWIPRKADFENANNNSLILRVTHGDVSFLLMGDAELEEEKLLMQSDMELHADVLKLGHHGETDANSPTFIARVKPKIGLIAGNAEENPDSVNDTVAGYLESFGTQAYYSEGETLDISTDGRDLTLTRVPDREFPVKLQLSFADVNRKEDTVTIRNNGETTADLSGCTLISTRGDEIFHFPAGTEVEAGKTLTVVCRDSKVTGDLVWDADSVWKKKEDDALLYDKNMNLLAENAG